MTNTKPKNSFYFYVVVSIFYVAMVLTSKHMEHPWNFSPAHALSLFLGFMLPSVAISSFLVLATTLISDFFLGFYPSLPFTYVGLIVIVFLGKTIRQEKGITQLIKTSLLMSLSFFLISNFGVWFAGSFYERTTAGLLLSYTMGLPFLYKSLASDLIYTLTCFGLVDLLQARWCKIRSFPLKNQQKKSAALVEP